MVDDPDLHRLVEQVEACRRTTTPLNMLSEVTLARLAHVVQQLAGSERSTAALEALVTFCSALARLARDGTASRGPKEAARTLPETQSLLLPTHACLSCLTAGQAKADDVAGPSTPDRQAFLPNGMYLNKVIAFIANYLSQC